MSLFIVLFFSFLLDVVSCTFQKLDKYPQLEYFWLRNSSWRLCSMVYLNMGRYEICNYFTSDSEVLDLYNFHDYPCLNNHRTYTLDLLMSCKSSFSSMKTYKLKQKCKFNLLNIKLIFNLKFLFCFSNQKVFSLDRFHCFLNYM